MLRKVWGFFDRAQEHYGMPWPVHYRLPEPDRVAVLKDHGAVASWAAADDRLGAPFLRSVLHDAPDRLLGRPG